MPGPLLHVGAVAACPHAAPANIMPSQTRVLVSGQPVATISSQITIAGCPFQIPAGPAMKPSPCLTAKWLMPAVRVLVMGQPAALAPGPSLAQSPEQIPQGPLILSVVQARVIGT